jgi:GntP family gluconate:H+ symporter
MSIEFIRIILALVISVAGIIVLSHYWKVHAFLSLLLAALVFGIINGQSIALIIETLQTGFGALLSHIGILVVMGSLLGMLLEKTGAMETISVSLLRIFGQRHAVLGMTTIGALVGIPVFCDSGFIILSKLIPAIAVKTSVNPASLSLGLSSGLYTTHSLVPPTPGPLAAAANLGAGSYMGHVILMGIAVSVPVVLVSFLLAKRFGAKITSSIMEEAMKQPNQLSPWKAFTPLMLPIFLIAVISITNLFEQKNLITEIIDIIGLPVVALSLGVLAALTLVKKEHRKNIAPWTAEAIKDAGVILLIIGAGGAFGAVIKASGIALVLKGYLDGSAMYGAAFFVLAFILAATLKTAQGSTTSSMIITSSLLAPLTVSAGIMSPTAVTLLVITIGGGAMTVSHVNDAYFWVISQYGKIGSDDTLKTHTLITFFQGVTTLLVCIILFLLL